MSIAKATARQDLSRTIMLLPTWRTRWTTGRRHRKIKAHILDLYDEEEISEPVARELLSDEAFEDDCEKSRGAELLLAGEPEVHARR